MSLLGNSWQRLGSVNGLQVSSHVVLLSRSSSLEHGFNPVEPQFQMIHDSSILISSLLLHQPLSLLAVQATVIPLLLSTPLSRSLYPHSSISDLCISAPTGSGKTLSYVIPILEVLRRRKVKKLRALVLLPTRDLVSQVKETFDLINKNLISEEEELKIGICTGNSSFIQEQNSLVEKKLNFNSNDLDFDDQDSLSLNSSSPTTKENSNRFIYSSKVDILLSTPGRLIDHLKSTKGFDLKHLRFLVIDEADRLMGQSFQEWIGRLEEEIDPKRFGKRDQDQDEEVDAPAWLKRDQDDLDQEVPSSVSFREKAYLALVSFESEFRLLSNVLLRFTLFLHPHFIRFKNFSSQQP